MKICCTCKQNKPFTEFYKNRAKKNGYQYQCKTCYSIYQKEYSKTAKGKNVVLKASQHYQKKHPEHQKARSAVLYAVRISRLSRLDVLPCKICSKQKAELYHHYKGYAKKNWLDIIPVCRKCHRKIHRRMKQ